jgi:hypothetical protein
MRPGVRMDAAPSRPREVQVVDHLGTRELFTTVTSRRDWKPFFQVSFGVFD